MTKEFLLDADDKKSKIKQKHADNKEEMQKKIKREQDKAERSLKREEAKKKELLQKLDEVDILILPPVTW